uniref:Uncharacterized protein n=1 Tax=Entomoneis paludosa TaxID=265537 RepID=A0A7S2YKM1_9STRA
MIEVDTNPPNKTIDIDGPEIDPIVAPSDEKKSKGDEVPTREMMLLWMERMKSGIDVIKTTFGPEWMYIWMMNEYGRALNARMKLENVVQAHVGRVAALIPNITHLEGHAIHDVTTQPIPFLAMRENQLRQTEGILGNAQVIPDFGAQRPRSMSAPDAVIYGTDESSDDEVVAVGVPGGSTRQAQELYQQQSQEYATALRELDLVMPAEPETEMATLSLTSTDSSDSAIFERHARRNRVESYPGPVSSSNDKDGLFHSPVDPKKYSSGAAAIRTSNRTTEEIDSPEQGGPLSVVSEIRGSVVEASEPNDQDGANSALIGRVVSTSELGELDDKTLDGESLGATPSYQKEIREKHNADIGAVPLPMLPDSPAREAPSYDLYSISSQPQPLVQPALDHEFMGPPPTPPGAAVYHTGPFMETDDDLTAPTASAETDGDDILSVYSNNGGSVSALSAASGGAASVNSNTSGAPVQTRLVTTKSISHSHLGSIGSVVQNDDGDDDHSSINLQLPGSLQPQGQHPAHGRPHLDSVMSNASTVQMKTNAAAINPILPARSCDDSDLLSTTSTIQMLEEMENGRTAQHSHDMPSTKVAQSLTSPSPNVPIPHNNKYSSDSGIQLPGLQQTSTGTFDPSEVSKNPRVMPVLERIMRQHDLGGNGISQAVATELSLLIWMMMDAGNAWTAMALSLLSTDKDACTMVQDELDALDMEFGNLTSPNVLNRMQCMDALIYEAIRLCPANLGGMKKTTATVEMPEAGVQIPKDTNIFFCQPTDRKFDLRGALGKKPEHLGRRYPCVELHGFLPLHGLEVPLMVLQSKVFLIALLQKFTPVLSLRKNLIRRVQSKVQRSLNNLRNRGNVSNLDLELSMHSAGGALNRSGVTAAEDHYHPQATFSDVEACVARGDVSHMEAMDMFTKTPFPEPRRVIHLRPRSLT